MLIKQRPNLHDHFAFLLLLFSLSFVVDFCTLEWHFVDLNKLKNLHLKIKALTLNFIFNYTYSTVVRARQLFILSTKLLSYLIHHFHYDLNLNFLKLCNKPSSSTTVKNSIFNQYLMENPLKFH